MPPREFSKHKLKRPRKGGVEGYALRMGNPARISGQ